MGDLAVYQSLISDSTRWHRLALRPGDIIISTPPKCGTTWTQMLCALLIFDGPTFPDLLDALSPWVDLLMHEESALFASLSIMEHRRFLKTHTPLDGLPQRDDVQFVVVGRDPRDAGVSWDHHVANIDGSKVIDSLIANGADLSPRGAPTERAETRADRLRAWMASERTEGSLDGLADVVHHLNTAWERRSDPNVVLLHYSDMQRDLLGEMRRLAHFIGVEVSDERLAELAPEASLGRMRDRADEVVPDTTSSDHWVSRAAFFRTGGTGEWQALMDDADRRLYADRIAALAPPDLARWLHDGNW